MNLQDELKKISTTLKALSEIAPDLEQLGLFAETAAPYFNEKLNAQVQALQLILMKTKWHAPPTKKEGEKK